MRWIFYLSLGLLQVAVTFIVDGPIVTGPVARLEEIVAQGVMHARGLAVEVDRVHGIGNSGTGRVFAGSAGGLGML